MWGLREDLEVPGGSCDSCSNYATIVPVPATNTQADEPPKCLAPQGWPPNYMPTQHSPHQVGPHLQPPPTRITTPISTAPHENPITQHGNQTTLTHPVLSPEDAAMAAAALGMVTAKHATTAYGALMTTTTETALAKTATGQQQSEQPEGSMTNTERPTTTMAKQQNQH
eukprot:CAMPEP_0171908782 /NCGR_PEP_ID=MMETSP0993-20121228/8177_1 /TAXON_ID=483369 /ORGANISM="non described non described, Strain CCMP2098" /LENGTH=168 /DNA_ID=CAMNT_0012541507 /DNA_START=169 /DNA_END=676 /DNA_ORIENTATION=+